MYDINYTIGLNEHGRPCIELPKDYEHRPEDRFFVLEVARYMLQDLLARRTPDLDSQTVSAIDEAERVIGQIGDEVAEILFEMMKNLGEASKQFGNAFDIKVESIEERDALPIKNILYKNMIFDREDELTVLVYTYDPETFMPVETRYRLVNGIDNENWVEL